MNRLPLLPLPLLTLALALSAALGAAAQTQTQLTPRTFAAAGARGVGTTVVLTYTIGQPFAASLVNAGATFRLTQGFQQPLLNGAAARPAAAVTAPHHKGALAVSIYPNPTPDRLHVLLTADAAGGALPAELTATFTDAAGRPVLTQPLRPAAGFTTLDLSGLPEGTYLLVLRDAAGRQVSTHRVVRTR